MNRYGEPKTITQLGHREAEFLATLSGQGREIFTFGEALEFFSGDRAKAHRYLYNLQRKGWLQRIERGKYLIIPLEAGPERHWS